MVCYLPSNDLGSRPKRKRSEYLYKSVLAYLQFLFFALFSIIGKTSSFIGPFVSSAIIDDSGNNNMPFTFLLGLGCMSVCILACVNVDKSRKECRKYLEDEAMRVYGMTSAELLVVGNASEMDGGRPVVVGVEKA
ncbi:hypothetical protein IAR55_000012 [Kwoniella newhampshirensis]|uniref:Autophagy-related protein n=1 Tax=Kwoniella newhampshirensis TaxID=1651941 RepID=A0AAW0Z5E7_9TREE